MELIELIKNKTNNRIDYIDLAKGFGMLLIIWGHINFGVTHVLVYAFHIPLFFFLSGLVFKKNRYTGFSHFLSKRIKGLLYPYAVFSIVTWLVWVGYVLVTHAPVTSYWMPLLQTVLAQGSEGYLVHNVPLWFVMCLFVVEVFYFFISSLPKAANMLVCIVLGVIGAWMSVTDLNDFSTLPWSIDVAFMAIPFYAAGSLLSDTYGLTALKDAIVKNKPVTIIVFLIVTSLFFVGALNNGHVSMGHSHLGDNPWIFYPTAACGVISFMIVCMALSATRWNDSAIVGGANY